MSNWRAVSAAAMAAAFASFPGGVYPAIDLRWRWLAEVRPLVDRPKLVEEGGIQ